MAKPQAKSLADFKSQFDPSIVIPNKVRAALESLRKEGPEAWEYEKDFLTRARMNAAQVTEYREQFSEHIVMVRMNGNEKRVWFADPKVAKKARGE